MLYYVELNMYVNYCIYTYSIHFLGNFRISDFLDLIGATPDLGCHHHHQDDIAFLVGG